MNKCVVLILTLYAAIAIAFAQQGEILPITNTLYRLGYPSDMVRTGDRIWLCGGTKPLIAMDISDIENPVYEHGWEITSDQGDLLEYVNGHLVLFNGDATIMVIDISETLAPVVVSNTEWPGSCLHSAVYGNFLIMIDYYHNLVAYDLSDPLQPVYADHIELPEYIYNFAITGDHVYAGYDRCYIIDLSDPYNLELAGTINQNQLVQGRFRGAGGNLLYYSTDYEDYSNISIFDISDRTNPIYITNLEVFFGTSGYFAAGTDYFVVAGGGYQVYDMRTPDQPQLASSGSYAYDISLDGDLLCIFQNPYQLWFLDLSDLDAIGTGGTYYGGAVNNVMANDTHAFVYLDGGCTKVMDITDPENPIQTGQYFANDINAAGLGQLYYTTISSTRDYDGDYLPGTVSFYDVNNSASSAPAGFLNTMLWGRPIGLAFCETDLAVSKYGGLEVWDIQDLSNSYLKFFLSGHDYLCTSLENGYIYTAVQYDYMQYALKIFDIAGTGVPTTSFQLTSEPRYLLKQGDLLFLAMADRSVHILDVHNPYIISEISILPINLYIKGIGLKGTNLVIASEENIQVWDVSDPAFPVQKTVYPDNNSRTDLAISGSYLYVAERNHLAVYDGTSAFQIDEPPVVPLRFLTYPNPFVNNVTLHFDLPKADWVSVSIYNIRGQKVKQYSARNYSIGQNTISWDAKDDNALPVTSGIYFCVFNSSSGKQVQRIVRTK